MRMHGTRAPMDDEAAGTLVRVLTAAGAVVALLVAVGGVLYAMDHGVEATVVDKQCRGGGGGGGGGLLGGLPGSGTTQTNSVTVEARLLPITHTVDGLSDTACNLVRADNFVRYHIRSERTVLYHEEGGVCIWDSADPARCGQ